MKPLTYAITVCAISTTALMGCQTPVTVNPSPVTVNPAPTSITALMLSEHTWQLVGVSDAEAFASVHNDYRLSFEQNRMTISGGCNVMSAAFDLTQNTLQVKPIMATRRACESRLMQADAAIVDAFAKPMQLSLRGASNPTLLMQNSAVTLQWAGERTLAAKYGAPQTQFLQVNPQRMTCYAGGEYNCLQVKTVQYNDQGVVVSKDPKWTTLMGEIQGYTHQSDHLNTIRVNRYQTPSNRPAGMPAYLYEYVSTVESKYLSQ